jgi:hypothetical protein
MIQSGVHLSKQQDKQFITAQFGYLSNDTVVSQIQYIITTASNSEACKICKERILNCLLR